MQDRPDREQLDGCLYQSPRETNASPKQEATAGTAAGLTWASHGRCEGTATPYSAMESVWTALLPLHVTVMDVWPVVQEGVIISVAAALFHPCQLCWHLAQHLLDQ